MKIIFLRMLMHFCGKFYENDPTQNHEGQIKKYDQNVGMNHKKYLDLCVKLFNNSSEIQKEKS